LSKRQKTIMSKNDELLRGRGGRGGVRVTTSRSIPSGSILQMSYGAKGNATLLGRYGFCISNNVEPDGTVLCDEHIILVFAASIASIHPLSYNFPSLLCIIS
jgi:hypothetical protein